MATAVCDWLDKLFPKFLKPGGWGGGHLLRDLGCGVLLGRGLSPGDLFPLQGSLVDRSLHWGLVPELTFQFTHWGKSLDCFLSLNLLGLIRCKKDVIGPNLSLLGYWHRWKRCEDSCRWQSNIKCLLHQESALPIENELEESHGIFVNYVLQAGTAEMKEDPKSEETCSSFQDSTVYQNNNNKSIL